jgi:hypothetical protein
VIFTPPIVVGRQGYAPVFSGIFLSRTDYTTVTDDPTDMIVGITTPSSGSTHKVLCGGTLKLASVVPPGNYYFVNSSGIAGWHSTLPANTTPLAVVHDRGNEKYLTFLGELAMKIDLAAATARLDAVEAQASTNQTGVSTNASNLSAYQTSNDAALNGYITSNDSAVSAIDVRLGTAEGSIGTQGTSISAMSDQLNTIDPDGITNNNVQSVVTTYSYTTGANALPGVGNFVRVAYDAGLAQFYPVLCWSDASPGQGYAVVRNVTLDSDGVTRTFDLITQGRGFVAADITGTGNEAASAELYLTTFSSQASATAASYAAADQWSTSKPTLPAGDFYGVARAIRSSDSDYPNQLDLASYLVTNA